MYDFRVQSERETSVMSRCLPERKLKNGKSNYSTVIVACVPANVADTDPVAVTTSTAVPAVGTDPAWNVAVSPLTVKYGASPAVPKGVIDVFVSFPFVTLTVPAGL